MLRKTTQACGLAPHQEIREMCMSRGRRHTILRTRSGFGAPESLMKHLLPVLFVATLAVGCQSKKDAPKNTEGSAKASTNKTTPATKTPASSSTAASSSTPASPGAAGPNQWYCYKMETFGECQSSLEGCKAKLQAEARILMKRGMNPIGLGACKPQPDAYCFTFNKPTYKKPKAKCNLDMPACKAMHTLYAQKWPDLAMTECQKVGAWQSGAAQPPASPPAK